MIKGKLRGLFVMAFIMATAICAANSGNANAVTDEAVNRWVASQWYNCITNGSLNNRVERGTTGSVAKAVVHYTGDGARLPNPSANYFVGAPEKPTCIDVLQGSNSWYGSQKVSGILEIAGEKYNATFSDLSDTDTVMKKLGYKPTDETKYFSIKVNKNTTTTQNGKQTSSENEPSSAKIKFVLNSEGVATYSIEGSQFANYFKLSFEDKKLHVEFEDKEYNTGFWATVGGASCSTNTGASSFRFDVPISTNLESFKNEIRQNLSQYADWTTTCTYNFDGTLTDYVFKYSFNVEDLFDEGEGSAWEIDQSENTAKSSVAQLGFPYASLALTGSEKYNMYHYYLKNTLGDLNSIASCSPGNGLTEVHLESSSGTMTKYYVNLSAYNLTEKRFNSLNTYANFVQVSLQDIIDFLNDFPAEDASNGECPGITEEVGPIDDTTVVDNSSNSNCYDSASALGWILCPIIKATANAVDGLYESIIEPFLSINAETFNTGSGVYQAWQLFQSFANIVFVILFLITIFSQLTGFGIDNLGIKRLLPKLIIAAILVNLSYIICQALVDLSNIIGYGANHLFDNITINGENGVSTGQSAITSLISLLGLGGGATIAVATAPIWGPSMIIPILLTLVSLLIGLVFAFVLLGARQAGVIILVFLAPIAFVLYMLPNTKPIFDKWKKAFTGLLLLYPICGLLMGGSKFAGNVLISTSKSFWVAAIGSLLSVIVFFFIPSLVRNSMTAVGNVGARISNLGQNLSRGAQQRVSNSQLAQDHMKRVAAGIDRNGNVTGRGRLMNRIANGESRFSRVPGVQRMASRSLARGRAAYVRDMQDQMNEARLNDPQFLENYQRQQQMAIEKESLQTEMDILKKDTNNGEIETNAKGTGLFDLYDQAIASGNIVRARAVAELAGRRKDTASRFAEHVKMGTATGAYDGAEGQNILAAVAKQISTGDNSKNYRAGNATGFEFASNINNGQATSTNYADWVANEDNINRVLENHITNNEELYSQSRSVLRELAGTPKQSNGATLYTPNISSDDRTYVSELAKYAEQQSKIGGAYDRTKDREMEALRNLTNSSDDNSGNNSNAAPGQTFNVNSPQNNPSQTSDNQNPTSSSSQ